mgnify:CR=1 FL=1
MSTSKQAAFNSIDALLARVGPRIKAAEANTEAGGIAGGTSHPVADADDRTEPASEGARSAENSDDVKNDQGTPAVDSTAPGTPGGQDSVQLNIGTSQKATGEDPAVETSSAKGGKEDGGYAGPSSHPARTDNDALDGNKYSAARKLQSSVKLARESGHALLAKIAVAAESNTAVRTRASKLAGEAMGGGEASAKLPPETVSDADSDANNPPPGKGEKSKEAAAVIDSIAMTIKSAEADAELVLSFLQSYSKTAADEAGPPAGEESHESSETPMEESAESAVDPTEPPAGGDAGGPPAGGAGGGMGGMDLSQISAEDFLMQLLSGAGGGDALGGGAPPMGGAPPAGGDIGGEAAMAGMLGGEGGAPPAGAPAPGGAGGGEEAMLAEALAQSGQSPEAFQAKAASVAARKLAGQTLVPHRWKPKTAQEAQQFQSVMKMVQEIANA